MSENNIRNRFKDPELGNVKNTEDYLNNENKNLLSNIAFNIKNIKNNGLKMKEKLNLSNTTVEEVSNTYEKSLKMVSTVFNNLTKVLSANTSLFCYLLIFILFIFVLLYFITN